MMRVLSDCVIVISLTEAFQINEASNSDYKQQ